MDRTQRLPDCIRAARAGHRCIVVSSKDESKVVRRLFARGELLEPYPRLYAERHVWLDLFQVERVDYMLRALALKHPGWVFAGLSAVAALELDHRLGLQDEDNHIYVAGSRAHARSRRLQHIPMEDAAVVRASGVPVTSVYRTLADCAVRYGFRDVLPMFDCALRRRLVSRPGLEESVAMAGRHASAVERLVRYTDSLSENGGESLCRATMLEEGFPVPRLQVEHPNLSMPGHVYRTDFEFTTVDGCLVFVEFDGMGKFVDSDKAQGRSVKAIVHAERRRERDLETLTHARIVRLDFVEVMKRTPMVTALLHAGVPRNGPSFMNAS